MPHRRVSTISVLGTLLLAWLTTVASIQAADAGEWTASSSTLSPETTNGVEQELALDRVGNAYAVWVDVPSRGANGVVTFSERPAGGSWTEPVPISDPAQDSFEPTVAVDPGGHVFVAWTRDDLDRQRVLVTDRPTHGTWSATVTVSDRDWGASRPDLAVDPQGNAVVVWTRYDYDDASTEWTQAAERPAGGAWSTFENLSPAFSVTPHVEMDAAGNATAVWGWYDGATMRVQTTSRPAGGTWSSPLTMTEEGASAYGPQIAVTRSGEAVAVWLEEVSGQKRVQGAARSADGVWGDPAYVSEEGRDADNPQVAIDEDGDAVAVWFRRLSVNDPNAVVSADLPHGGTWTTPRTLSTTGATSFDPQVAADAAGNAVAVWSGSLGGKWVVQASQRTVGQDWTTPLPLSASQQDASTPRVAFDDLGNALIAWSRYDGDHDRVQATGLDGAGPVDAIVSPVAEGQVGVHLDVAWNAVDAWSEVATHDVRYRVAGFQSGFNPRALWLDDVAVQSGTFTARPGNTYCFSARSQDVHGYIGEWSAERCTVTPIDDRSFEPRGGWSRKTGEADYRGTYTVASRRGATLTLAGVHAKRLELVVTRVPDGGRVEVSFKGASLGTFSLRSSKIQHRAVIPVEEFSAVRTGKVRITVVSKDGKAVRIDGVLASRR